MNNVHLQKRRCLQMQAMMETLFDVVYLTTVITLGVKMIQQSNGRKQYRLFGVMAVTLGLGDAFHLVPRAWALCTTGLESYAAALGIGKLVTSVTMTVFYVILYHVWQQRYHITSNKNLTITVYLLAAVRVALCLFPQNQWLSAHPPVSWGILRNIPFALLGLLVIILFYRQSRQTQDKAFWYMWLTIVLSFGFYIPVVLWADTIPTVGILMIPKTCAYVWTVWIGYHAMKNNN